jgi:hypothetical protein
VKDLYPVVKVRDKPGAARLCVAVEELTKC